MSAKEIVFIVFCSLLIQASAYNLFFPSQLCEATVTNDALQANVFECLRPPQQFFSGGGPLSSGAGLPSYLQNLQVTKPAKLKAVTLSWFLNSDGNPAINATVESNTPASPQEYTFFLLPVGSGHISYIFCGRVVTPEPDVEDAPQKTSFGLEMRCNANELKPGMKIDVSVQLKGDSSHPLMVSYVLPTCKDQTMRNSNACKEERRRRIQFHCQQEGNSTLVILNAKTAYLQEEGSPQVYVTIRNKDAQGLEGSKGLHKINWPERSVRFNNLKAGNTYQVLVWRKGDDRRYSELITMKPERKEERANLEYTKQKKLAKKKANRAKRFQRQQNRL